MLNYLLIIQLYLFKEILGKINVWIVNEAISNDFLDCMIRPEYLHKAVFLIVIDLSKVS